MSSRVRSQVELDLDQIAQLRTKYRTSLALADSDLVEHETVVVLGAVMHSFYNGAENAIKRILIATDGNVPSGAASHADLLRQASTAQANRPAVMSEVLHALLLPFMAYRHFFRHAYSFQMDWDRMQGLVQTFGGTAEALTGELNSFLDWLDRNGSNERRS